MTDGVAPGLFLGQTSPKDGARPERLLYDRANRHGVVAGATGTGKTVTLQIMAQGFSDAGVPVFCADVKGDLSGIAVPGSPNEKLLARAAGMGLTLQPKAAPVVFHVADTEGLLLLDLDDLRALLVHVGENAERIGREVGNVAPASIAAIQRSILEL